MGRHSVLIRTREQLLYFVIQPRTDKPQAKPKSPVSALANAVHCVVCFGMNFVSVMTCLGCMQAGGCSFEPTWVLACGS